MVETADNWKTYPSLIEAPADFLGELPLALDAESRIFFESLAFASDLVTSAMKTLTDLAIAVTDRPGNYEFTNAERLLAFTLTWNIIDNGHNLFKLLGKAEKYIGKIDNLGQLLDRLRGATLLRDKMDHLGSNLGNLGKAKKLQHPLFGAITFAHSKTDVELRPDDPLNLSRYLPNTEVVILTASSIQKEGFKVEAAKSALLPLTGKCAHFVLHAYGFSENLENIVLLAIDLRRFFDNAVLERWKAVAPELALRDGVEELEVWRPVIKKDTLTALIRSNGGPASNAGA